MRAEAQHLPGEGLVGELHHLCAVVGIRYDDRPAGLDHTNHLGEPSLRAGEVLERPIRPAAIATHSEENGSASASAATDLARPRARDSRHIVADRSTPTTAAPVASIARASVPTPAPTSRYRPVGTGASISRTRAL